MSKLRIEVLTPPSPYQTYLEERLQSARGLGWTYAAPKPAEVRPEPASLPAFAAAAAQVEPA
jgi:hypothetical protein